jgi:hypothetical protein
MNARKLRFDAYLVQFIRDASKRARFPTKAFGSAFNMRNRVCGLINHIVFQERTEMSFRYILSLISSLLLRNVHGFRKGIRKYISTSELRFRPDKPL